jgi:hypothetical protein
MRTFMCILVLGTMPYMFAQSMQTKKNKNETKKLEIDFPRGALSFNLYSDFGYVIGPQKTNTYFDFITKDTITDFGRRDYTSYPLYANSFAMSYGFIQAQYDLENKLKVKLAFHAGHIVEALYTEEMNSLKFIRESSISYNFTKKLSTEIGIFPSYYGAEIVLNKENFHATRAYIADFTPDYEAGIRAHYEVNKNLKVRAMLLNGWQEIKDLNGKKAFGLGLSYAKEKKMNLDWHIYMGNETSIGSNVHKYRFYNNLYSKISLGKKWVLFPVLDFVIQEKENQQKGIDYVVAPAFSARYQIKNNIAFATRYEYLFNKFDIIPELKTNSPNGWQSNSFTLTLEYTPIKELTFRAEGRYGWNKDKVFRNSSNNFTRIDKYLILSASFYF